MEQEPQPFPQDYADILTMLNQTTLDLEGNPRGSIPVADVREVIDFILDIYNSRD